MNVLVKATREEKIIYTACPEENASKLKALFEEYGATAEVLSYPVSLEALPEEVQNEVKDVLKAFNQVSVVYENSKFRVSTGVGVYSHYAYDHMVCGRYNQEEVYTKEERARNFKEEFGYTPCYL